MTKELDRLRQLKITRMVFSSVFEGSLFVLNRRRGEESEDESVSSS